VPIVPSDLVLVATHLPPGMAATLKARAAEADRTVSAELRRVIRRDLDAPSTTEAAGQGGSGKTRGTARDEREV
jgi:plasmid stability protein